jgi:hypothetical protein
MTVRVPVVPLHRAGTATAATEVPPPPRAPGGRRRLPSRGGFDGTLQAVPLQTPRTIHGAGTYPRTHLRSATAASRRDKRHCQRETNATVVPGGGRGARETNAIVRHARPARCKINLFMPINALIRPVMRITNPFVPRHPTRSRPPCLAPTN